MTAEFAQNTGTPQTKHEHAKRSSDHTSKTIAKNNSRTIATIATIAKKTQKTSTQHRTTPGHAASSSAWMHPQLLKSCRLEELESRDFEDGGAGGEKTAFSLRSFFHLISLRLMAWRTNGYADNIAATSAARAGLHAGAPERVHE